MSNVRLGAIRKAVVVEDALFVTPSLTVVACNCSIRFTDGLPATTSLGQSR